MRLSFLLLLFVFLEKLRRAFEVFSGLLSVIFYGPSGPFNEVEGGSVTAFSFYSIYYDVLYFPFVRYLFQIGKVRRVLGALSVDL